jgi:hypothetical protein
LYNVHSRLAFGTIFKITGGYRKSGTSFLKRELLDGFSQLASYFILEASRNFSMDFMEKKTVKHVEYLIQKIVF